MSNIDDKIDNIVKNMTPEDFKRNSANLLTPKMKRKKFVDGIKKGAESLGLYYGPSSGSTSSSQTSNCNCSHQHSQHIHRPRTDTVHDHFDPGKEHLRRERYNTIYKMTDGKGDDER